MEKHPAAFSAAWRLFASKTSYVSINLHFDIRFLAEGKIRAWLSLSLIFFFLPVNSLIDYYFLNFSFQAELASPPLYARQWILKPKDKLEIAPDFKRTSLWSRRKKPLES